MAAPPQRPLSFVPKVAFVERFNCILLGYKWVMQRRVIEIKYYTYFEITGDPCNYLIGS